MSYNRNRRNNVRHIVVHTTATRADMLVKDMEQLPYHFLITRGGKLLSLHPVKSTNRTVDIALLGGLDRDGRHVDNRTTQQNETLFATLVLLSEQFTTAAIIGADERYKYGFANPGFDVKEWLSDYIPSVLAA